MKSEKLQEEILQISKISNSFEDVLEIINTLFNPIPSVIEINCNFYLYYIMEHSSNTITTGRLKVYSIYIHNKYNSICDINFLTKTESPDNCDYTTTTTISTTRDIYRINRYIIIEKNNIEYFVDKNLFIDQINVRKNNHIKNLFDKLIIINDKYEKIYNNISKWD